MFLTRMALDTNRAAANRALSQPDVLRDAILECFDGTMLRPLWRVDTLRDRQYLMILSLLRPTMNALHESFGILGAFPSWETTYIGDTLGDLHTGDRLSFELVACTERMTAAQGELADRIRCLPQGTTAANRAWLLSHAENCGFEVQEADILVAPPVWQVFKPQGSEETHLYQQARFSGVLTVTEPELFVRSVMGGIGKGRKYGMGLMTVEPARHYIHT